MSSTSATVRRPLALPGSIDLPTLAALGRHWLTYQVTRRRRPLLAGFKLTHRCNLRCRTCPFWRQPRSDVSFKAINESLGTLREWGCLILILEGGEPFLWHDGEKDVEDVVQAARQHGFRRVAITTNGTQPLRSSADILFVSFDGLREAHEMVRGRILDKVMSNLAESNHPHVFAQITISSANWRDIPELVRQLSGMVRGITCQFYYPYPGSDDFWLPWPERKWVLDQLRSLKKAGYPVAHSDRVLRELASPGWRCRDWLVANAEPDPQTPGAAILQSGCYLNGRATSNCEQCGFAAHTELSRAYELLPGALWSGQQVFSLAWRPRSERPHA